MENNTLKIKIKKIKICKICALSENETTIMYGRRVCNKCRNTASNALLAQKGYFNNEKNKIKRHEYYENNKETILLRQYDCYHRKKQSLEEKNEN